MLNYILSIFRKNICLIVIRKFYCKSHIMQIVFYKFILQLIWKKKNELCWEMLYILKMKILLIILSHIVLETVKKKNFLGKSYKRQTLNLVII